MVDEGNGWWAAAIRSFAIIAAAAIVWIVGNCWEFTQKLSGLKRWRKY